MAIPSQRKYDDIHAANIEKYSKLVRKYYLETIKATSKAAVGLNLNANNEFFFRNNPEVSEKVNKLLKQLYTNVYGTTVEGINSEWDLAVEKNNELARYVYGSNLDDLPVQYRDKYFSNNAKARQNFVYRKEKGLGLSDKVWKNTRQFKTELELALEHGIGKGKSAASIARDVTGYLNEPDKLFRRIREGENGPLRLSKAAKAYNPGQGRYRSSYKNSLRLTANETNFSYEGSQKEKRAQQDFIVGIEIKTSPRHKASDDKGGISCISLQGKYPKDFEWTYKWHVNCRCLSLNILKSREELDKDIDLILAGKEPTTKSKNEIKGVPKSYTGYLSENKKKWANYKNQPRTFELNKDMPKQVIPKPKPKVAEFNLAEYEKGFNDKTPLYNREIESGATNLGTSAAKTYRGESSNLKFTHPSQNDALEAYTGNDYRLVREYNTTGKAINSRGDDVTALIADDIKSVSTFIDNNTINENLKLYRQIKGPSAITKFKSYKKGDIFTDNSFVSTSLVPQKGFGAFPLEIFAKAGAKVANANNLSELEYLIQKGQRFKVLSNSENKIKLELL